MAYETSKPKLKRRRLQFSLRMFLIAGFILSILFGLFVFTWNRAEQQKQTVQWVKLNGGKVYYDFQLDSEGNETPDSLPPGPEWLTKILGVDFFSNIVYVNVSSTNDIDGIVDLGTMNKLKYLKLDDTQINDLSFLANLNDLELLWLNNTHVSDISPLARKTKIRNLHLGNTQVNDLLPLARLSNLQCLDLDNTAVRDVTPLAGLTNLECLELDNTSVSDLTPLTGLRNLESLELINTNVSKGEIRKLQKSLPHCVIWHEYPDD